MWGCSLAFSGLDSNALFLFFPLAAGLFTAALASAAFMAAALFQKIPQKTGAVFAAIGAVSVFLLEVFIFMPFIESSVPCNLNFAENSAGYIPLNAIFVAMTGEFLFSRAFLFTFNILSPASALYMVLLILQNAAVYALLKAKNRHFFRTIPCFACALFLSLAATAGGAVASSVDFGNDAAQYCGTPQSATLETGEAFNFEEYYLASCNRFAMQPPDLAVYRFEGTDGEGRDVYTLLSNNDIRQSMLIKDNELTFFRSGVYRVEYRVVSNTGEFLISYILYTTFTVYNAE